MACGGGGLPPSATAAWIPAADCHVESTGIRENEIVSMLRAARHAGVPKVVFDARRMEWHFMSKGSNQGIKAREGRQLAPGSMNSKQRRSSKRASNH